MKVRYHLLGHTILVDGRMIVECIPNILRSFLLYYFDRILVMLRFLTIRQRIRTVN